MNLKITIGVYSEDKEGQSKSEHVDKITDWLSSLNSSSDSQGELEILEIKDMDTGEEII